jgi:hypothetical protein
MPCSSRTPSIALLLAALDNSALSLAVFLVPSF